MPPSLSVKLSGNMSATFLARCLVTAIDELKHSLKVLARVARRGGHAVFSQAHGVATADLRKIEVRRGKTQNEMDSRRAFIFQGLGAFEAPSNRLGTGPHPRLKLKMLLWEAERLNHWLPITSFDIARRRRAWEKGRCVLDGPFEDGHLGSVEGIRVEGFRLAREAGKSLGGARP